MRKKSFSPFEAIETSASSLFLMSLDELLTTKLAATVALKTIERIVKSKESGVELVWLYRDLCEFIPHLNTALKEQYLQEVEFEIGDLFDESFLTEDLCNCDYEDEIELLFCMEIMPLEEIVKIPTYEELYPIGKD